MNATAPSPPPRPASPRRSPCPNPLRATTRPARRLGLLLWGSALSVLVFGAPGPAAAQAQQADSAAAIEVVADFHAALAAGDSAAVIALLAPEARIAEGSRIETVDEYRSGHLAADMAYAGAVERTRTVVAVSLYGDAAVVHSTSRTRGTFRDREIDSRGAETMVLLRRDGAWRIVGVHWS